VCRDAWPGKRFAYIGQEAKYMIRLIQLRINNMVSHGGKAGRVIRLTPETVNIEYENGYISPGLSEEDITGISLTPELLRRCGFIDSGGSNTYQFVLNEDAVITINPHILGGHSVQLCVKGNWCGKPIQHLHELQNIYIDLTGEEMVTD
jgi:hypothetical protein